MKTTSFQEWLDGVKLRHNICEQDFVFNILCTYGHKLWASNTEQASYSKDRVNIKSAVDGAKFAKIEYINDRFILSGNTDAHQYKGMIEQDITLNRNKWERIKEKIKHYNRYKGKEGSMEIDSTNVEEVMGLFVVR
ncbi:hypothetical protein K9O30_06310 [Clostridium bowmanii]|uniref:hypothetical protein n=1 Tax=Clostridium bowmanii TaxID=132925 RepID=UPI001C0D7D26|nr:hypothetical protein [Clostridium bowmanii]MBU3188773.1 hypothetical protein [Clostridium bowmanii]MCA1073357.1 hypothetical protein [Clostridium bowmanii]